MDLTEIFKVRLVMVSTAASLSGPGVELTETSSMTSLLGPELEQTKASGNLAAMV